MHLPLRIPVAPSSGDLLAMILAFGWEGPWVVWLGMQHAVWAECLLGLLMTVLSWRHISTALRERLDAAELPSGAL